MAQLRKGTADCFHSILHPGTPGIFYPTLHQHVVEWTCIYRLFLARVYNSKQDTPNAVQVLDSISEARFVHQGPVTVHKYAAQYQVGK